MTQNPLKPHYAKKRLTYNRPFQHPRIYEQGVSSVNIIQPHIEHVENALLLIKYITSLTTYLTSQVSS